jgi:hypothetical protein
MHRTLALALLLGSALAQNLVSLAPPGAVAGFYLADLRGSPYLQGFAADWKASGMEALLGRELRQQVGQAVDLLGLAAGGLVAAAYPDGFFVLGRPSPGALEALRKEARGLQSLGGWQVGGDKEVQIGLSRELFFVASPEYAQLFLQNRRGLGAPARGDLVFWGSLPQGLAQDLGLPPRTSSALRALGRFTYSLQLSPGGYTEEGTGEQFSLGDHRSLEEVIRDIATLGYIPSFCTGCYRLGRTGQDFMDLAKPGLIKHFCLPNAITSFKEYLVNYATPETRAVGETLIEKLLTTIPDETLRARTRESLTQIESGAVDVYV